MGGSREEARPTGRGGWRKRSVDRLKTRPHNAVHARCCLRLRGPSMGQVRLCYYGGSSERREAPPPASSRDLILYNVVEAKKSGALGR